jgi:hypothetical protein
MAKKKIKMTDTKVRVVVVTVILLAFILALYFIFREPTKVCPKGQMINTSGKCVDDPNFCSESVGKSWKCTSASKCVRQKDGACRDCADADEVYAEANPATVAFLKGKRKGEGEFGVENLLSKEKEYTCQRRCDLNNNENCPDDGTCAYANFNIDDEQGRLGPKPKVCKYKPIWYGVPTKSNGSYVCKPYPPGTVPKGTWNFAKEGGAYTSLRQCAMDQWKESENDKIPAGFAVGDYKNNNCLKRGSKCYNAYDNITMFNLTTERDCKNNGNQWSKSGGDPKLNANNTDCNTYPCTKNALQGWGSHRTEGAPSNESDLYLYQKPQKDDTYGPKDDDESMVGTCFKTYKKNGNVEVATAPQVPDENDNECNKQTNEHACRVAAYPDDNSEVPHCKWYPAGSCLRVPSKLNPPTVNFDIEGHSNGIIMDNQNLIGIGKNAKDKNTDFPNFYGGKSQDYFHTDTYPKVLDYDPTISNCKHKLVAQGVTDAEAVTLCGNLNEGEEFNPLEFRRCAGVVANKDPGYPTFHTSMHPFLTNQGGVIVSLGSPDGNIGVNVKTQNQNSQVTAYCARGASCAGKDADAVTAAMNVLDNKISGLTPEHTLFPVADTYCDGCDTTDYGNRSNNWCRATKESNSKWSTSKNLKKVTMTNATGIAKKRKPDECFNNWYKDYSDACGN